MNFPELAHLNINVDPIRREVAIADAGVSPGSETYHWSRYLKPLSSLFPGHASDALIKSVWVVHACSSQSFRHAEAMAQDFVALATKEKAEATA